MPQHKSDSTAALHEQLKSDVVEQKDTVELEEKCRLAEEKAVQSYDQMLRIQAETENLRRRLERDMVSAQKFAIEKFVMELLPVVDGFERALAAHAGEESGSGSLLDGVVLTLKMLQAAFNKFGVQEIDPINQPFNPEHHQAVSMQSVPSVKPGIVLNVLQKGYLLNDRLIRPALVVVSKSES